MTAPVFKNSLIFGHVLDLFMSEVVEVPENHSIMITVHPTKSCLLLHITHSNSSQTTANTCCLSRSFPVSIFNATQVVFDYRTWKRCKKHLTYVYQSVDSNLRVIYSFHNFSSQPELLQNGKWNCSVKNWSNFKNHFSCDLRRECQVLK